MRYGIKTFENVVLINQESLGPVYVFDRTTKQLNHVKSSSEVSTIPPSSWPAGLYEVLRGIETTRRFHLEFMG